MATTPDNKVIYDQNWEQWEAMKRFGPMSRHGQRLALREAKRLSFSSVLDVGCGPGVFLSILARRYPGVAVCGTDISETAVALAQKNVVQGRFYTLDITKTAPPGTYDLVTMLDVAEHIQDDCAAFETIRTVCNKYLMILTLEGRMRDFEPEVGHVRNYQPGELKSKLEKSGYDVIRYVHWGWPMYSPLYRDASKSIDAIHKPMSRLRIIASQLAYWLLACNVPGKGDFVVVVAQKKA